MAILLLLAYSASLLSSAHGTMSEKNVYCAKGGSIVLSVEVPEGIKVDSVIWKHNKDKAAEWFTGDDKPTYFDKFNSKATLDNETWALTLSNVQPHLSGNYSAQVNLMDPTNYVTLTVVDNILYGVKEKSITLQANVPSIDAEHAQWKHNETIIADWDYKTQQIRCLHRKIMKIDNKTWSLTISDLKPNLSGLYVLHLNNIHRMYQLIVVEPVQLKITRECNSTSCTLNCAGDHNENIEVSWTDNKGEKKSVPVLVVERSEHLDVTYTCTSDSGSGTKSISEKDLFPNYSVSGDEKPKLGIILGCIGAGVLVLLAVGVYWRWKGQLQNNGHIAVPLEEGDGNPLHTRMEESREEAQPQNNGHIAPLEEDDGNPLTGTMEESHEEDHF